eukprot:5505912-Prymnesium_polylepis.1
MDLRPRRERADRALSVRHGFARWQALVRVCACAPPSPRQGRRRSWCWRLPSGFECRCPALLAWPCAPRRGLDRLAC